MLYRSLRSALFRLSAKDPEGAHERVIDLLAAVSRSSRLTAGMRALYPPVESPRLRRHLFGLTFPNPIGLAAGFDKNAVALPALAALGFGFIEAGTVTYHAQPGNPRPRIVRLPERRALVNRMGFNNDGAAVIAGRLAQGSRPPVPLGISLGKSRVTPLERAMGDYRASYRLLAPHADYIAVNVSSPNTPNLRSLQEREQVDALLTALQSEAVAIAEQTAHPHPPLLVKVAPDLTDETLEELLGVCLARGVDGVIAVNTTVGRPTPPAPLPEGKGETRLTAVCQDLPLPFREGGRGGRSAGGLSGRPLFPRALEVVRHIRTVTGGRLPIIGVGGIFSAADAYAMIRAGAALVQVYTGMIYEGPSIARQINRGLLQLLERDGFNSIDEASSHED